MLPVVPFCYCNIFLVILESWSNLLMNYSPDISQDSTQKEKPETTPKMAAKSSHLASGMDSNGSAQLAETRLADLLDNTLWNRRLAPSSERIVYALVQQIFHGIKEYFLASAELKVHILFQHLLSELISFLLHLMNYTPSFTNRRWSVRSFLFTQDSRVY